MKKRKIYLFILVLVMSIYAVGVSNLQVISSETIADDTYMLESIQDQHQEYAHSIKVSTPKESLNFKDMFTDTLKLSEIDLGDDGIAAVGVYLGYTTNVKFNKVIIPKRAVYDEAKERVDYEFFVEVKLADETIYQLNIAFNPSESIVVTEEEITELLQIETSKTLPIIDYRFVFSSKSSGKISKIVLSDNILFTYDYQENGEMEDAFFGEEEMLYTLYIDRNYEYNDISFKYPLTSKVSAFTADKIKINQEFDYTISVDNNSNILNNYKLRFPARRGMEVINDDASIYQWKLNKKGTDYELQQGKSAKLINLPSEKSTYKVKLKLNEAYQSDEFVLNADWSAFALEDWKSINETTHNDVIRDKVTVTFESLGGSMIEPIKVDYGSLINAPQNVVKEGYRFIAWYSDQNYSNAWDFTRDKVTSDMTLYAKWEAVNKPEVSAWYTVTFDSQLGSEVAPLKNVKAGSLITQPINPIRDDYKFCGWFQDQNYTNAWDFTKDQVTSDMTLYAKWEAVNKPEVSAWYTVTFDSQLGSEVAPLKNVKAGSLITQPINPVRDDYKFCGWFHDQNYTNAWDFTRDQVTTDMTLYAKWERNSSVNDDVNHDKTSYLPSTGKVSLQGLNISLVIMGMILVFVDKNKS